MNRLDISPSLLARYDVSAPRYTSYPPIPYWPDAAPEDWARWIEAKPEAAHPSLSLYLHIPFCASRCWYCGCCVIVTQHRDRGERYAETLALEMELVKRRLKGDTPVRQFHFGGGTPNYLNLDTLGGLVETARRRFPFADDVEISIEVDPRTVDPREMGRLRSLGFNRLSLGIQDFDEDVQRAVNRVQPFAMVQRLMRAARAEGFDGINFDLIYGLPRQTQATFRATLDRVRELAPDRLAVYQFAHLPQAMPYQRRFDPATVPDRDTKLEIFQAARERLLEWGYIPIGLDHFALPEDELAVALGNGSLQRNFMGYTTKAGTDLLAFGLSSVSDYNGAIWQNEKILARYNRAVRAGIVPVTKGMRLSPDDQLRKAVIGGLFCGGRVDLRRIAQLFGIDPRRTLRAELEALKPLAADGLVEIDAREIRITERGQFFLRNVALVFDAYHGSDSRIAQSYSRAV